MRHDRLSRKNHRRRVARRRVLDPAAVEQVDELHAQLRELAWPRRRTSASPAGTSASRPGLRFRRATKAPPGASSAAASRCAASRAASSAPAWSASTGLHYPVQRRFAGEVGAMQVPPPRLQEALARFGAANWRRSRRIPP